MLTLLQRRGPLRSRQGRADENSREEREPEREAALPSTTHEGGHYLRDSHVVLLTNENFWRGLCLEPAESGDFVRGAHIPERGSFRLGKRLQTSEVAARVPNLCGPAPSGTAPSTPAGKRE